MFLSNPVESTFDDNHRVHRPFFDCISTTIAPPYTPFQPFTFGELLHMWEVSNALRLKGGTQQKYSFMVKTHILPELGAIPLTDINASLLNTFLIRKIRYGRKDGNGGLSHSYVRSLSIILSAALQFGAEEGLCAPLQGKISKPSILQRELSILSLQQQRQLEHFILASPGPTTTGMMLSLYAGLRIGEVCALSWEDIDFDSETIYIRHTVSRVPSDIGIRKTALILDAPKTTSSRRKIPIASPLSPVLRRQYSLSDSPFVVSDTGTFLSPRTYDYRFHRILQYSGIADFGYHALRHTFATRCIESGVDTKSLSELLGHANAAVTLNTYVHSSFEMKKIQLEKLASHCMDRVASV